jgi:hypothetical protein
MSMPAPAEAAKTEAARQAVILIFGVVTLLIMMTLMRPDSVRSLRMRTAAASSRLLSRAALLLGHACMGTELATGRREYQVPLAISVLRDRMDRAYQQARDEP